MAGRLDVARLEALLTSGRPGLSELTDDELLRRFAHTRDEAAFTALVQRHGDMVLGVCRRVLGRAEDAEDAFQATFLTLARRAGASGWRASLAGWLYATARQVSLNARRRNERRERRERRAEPSSCDGPLEQLTAKELLAALDEELARLPERYRSPLVLCCLEGLTRDEAAGRLAVPPATLKSQLERGRRLLSAALERRGLSLGAGLLALTVASPAAAASPGLTRSVVALALEECAVNSWMTHSLRLLVAAALLGGLCAAPLLSGYRPPPAAPAAPRPAEPDAADLVRGVRAGQTWLHKAKTFSARLEGKRTDTATGKVFGESYEVTFDGRRMRHATYWAGINDAETIWDGQRAVARWKYDRGPESFSLHADRDHVASQMLCGLPWLWLHPHAFWWSKPDGSNEWVANRERMGEPKDFIVTGRQVYRGVPCVVLHKKKGGEFLRYYVGERTGRLHGLMSGRLPGNPQADRLAQQFAARHGKSLRTEDEMWEWMDVVAPVKGDKRVPLCEEWFALLDPTEKPKNEVWMLDYKEVKPGCWFPMTQGNAGYYDQRDVRRKAVPTAGTFDKPTASITELRATRLSVNEPLPASTFVPSPLSEGAEIHERTSDGPIRYTYRAADGPEVRKALLAEARSQKEKEAKEKARREELVGTAALAFPKAEWVNSKPLTWADLKGKHVVLVFWSEGCGSCRANKLYLGKASDNAELIFIGVHGPGGRAEVEKALQAAKADGPVLLDPKGEGDGWYGVLYTHYRLTRVSSAVLIDHKGKVAALGDLQEVIRKATAAAKPSAK